MTATLPDVTLGRNVLDVWMIEFAETYRVQGHAWTSHHAYLVRNAHSSPKMLAFFDGLKRVIDLAPEDGPERIDAITAHVSAEVGRWIEPPTTP